jgi:hypothetical protein
VCLLEIGLRRKKTRKHFRCASIPGFPLQAHLFVGFSEFTVSYGVPIPLTLTQQLIDNPRLLVNPCSPVRPARVTLDSLVRFQPLWFESSTRQEI